MPITVCLISIALKCLGCIGSFDNLTKQLSNTIYSVIVSPHVLISTAYPYLLMHVFVGSAQSLLKGESSCVDGKSLPDVTRHQPQEALRNPKRVPKSTPPVNILNVRTGMGEQKLFKILNKHEHTGLSLVRDGGSIYWLPESWPWLALGTESKEHSTTPSVLIKIGMAAEKKTPWPSLFLGVKSSHPSWWGK